MTTIVRFHCNYVDVYKKIISLVMQVVIGRHQVINLFSSKMKCDWVYNYTRAKFRNVTKNSELFHSVGIHIIESVARVQCSETAGERGGSG